MVPRCCRHRTAGSTEMRVEQRDERRHGARGAKGLSDLHVVQVTIQPGGTLGWHSHLGPSFVIVKSGAATFYHGDDPTCTAHVIPTGSSLYEPAGMVHIVRNEGTEPLVNVVVQLLPTGAPRLISEPDPGQLLLLSPG